ncbi:MAG: imidazole glycerol phosphate synthase subunit HisH [Candidatus Omnitrophica bacterium]|nr:imidazole glycerol phosphate synthase subunit HisH [Candidatus Omnitrophota bacterium]
MIVIVDYNMGNLRSVEKAIDFVGGDVVVSSDSKIIEEADKIILPGVGAFPDGMRNLQNLGLIEVLKKQILVYKKPILGICLGMQLLANKSYEFGETKGLGIIDAEIIRFSFDNNELKVPHIGWNNIKIVNTNCLLNRVQDGDSFYFVHSFFMKNNNPTDVSCTCDYGVKFTAAICRDNVYATQFHPEKSQEKGLNILQEFVHMKSGVYA